MSYDYRLLSANKSIFVSAANTWEQVFGQNPKRVGYILCWMGVAGQFTEFGFGPLPGSLVTEPAFRGPVVGASALSSPLKLWLDEFGHSIQAQLISFTFAGVVNIIATEIVYGGDITDWIARRVAGAVRA